MGCGSSSHVSTIEENKPKHQLDDTRRPSVINIPLKENDSNITENTVSEPSTNPNYNGIILNSLPELSQISEKKEGNEGLKINNIDTGMFFVCLELSIIIKIYYIYIE